MARKYRFPDRQSAEDAYHYTDKERLKAEWFASALLMGKLQQVGTVRESSWTTTVCWFATQHSYFVAAYTSDRGSCHCIRGVWDTDELGPIVAALLRYDDSHDFGRLLDKARYEAVRSTRETISC